MKGDVIEKIKMKAHEISEPIYNEIIDTVALEYEKEMKASHEEINELAQDLKKHWKTINNMAQTAKKDAGKGIKKIAKKSKTTIKKSFQTKSR